MTEEWVGVDDALAETVALLGTNGSAPTPEPDSWTLVDLTTLPDQPPVQPTLGGTGLIYPGKRHVFSGPPESAKTLAAYTILIMVARTGHTAILIDFEMGPYDARQRLYELGATTQEVQAVRYLEPSETATDDRIQALVNLHPALLVVDAAAGAYNLEGLDDNRRQDVEQIAHHYVQPFWRAGIASIFIDHVVKNTENRGRFAIGSERKLGGADVHFGFEPIQAISRGTTGLYKIVTHKDRGGWLKRGHLANLELDSCPDTHTITWTVRQTHPADNDEGYFRPTHLMEKASIDLEHRPDPVGRNAIHDALGGRKEYVLKAVDVLVREGYVTETAGPNRSRLLTSEKPYRENDETATPENGSTMRPEPPAMFSSETTSTQNQDSAQPSGGSVVPGGSRVVPGTTQSEWFRGSPSLRGEPPEPPRPDHPNEDQWFRDLTTPPDDTYLDSLEHPEDEPRPDDPLPF